MKSQVRKIVKVGEKSYAITLPKEWVKTLRLDIGDQLYVVENDDRTLTIAPLELTLDRQARLVTYVALPRALVNARSISKVILALYSAGLSGVVLDSEALPDYFSLPQNIAKVDKSADRAILTFREPRADVSEVLETMAYKTREAFRLFLENLDQQLTEVWEEIHRIESEVDILFHLVVRLVIKKLISETLSKGPESESIIRGILDTAAGRILEGLTDCVDRSVHRVKELSAISRDYREFFTKVRELGDEAVVCYLHRCPIDEVVRHLNTASKLRVELKELTSTSIPPLLPLLSELEVAVTLLEDLLEVTLTTSYR